jgi:hypothetical protein
MLLGLEQSLGLVGSVGSNGSISSIASLENVVQLLVVMLVGISMGYILRGPGSADVDAANRLQSDAPDDLPAKPDKVPKHVAVIMDGNRRFGRMQHSDPLKVRYMTDLSSRQVP